MARKTPGGDDSGQKRRRSKPRSREAEETPPPLTQKEFEQAFKQYCSEKGAAFILGAEATVVSRFAPLHAIVGSKPVLCVLAAPDHDTGAWVPAAVC